MKIEHAFDVEAPIQTVWEALTDIERVSPCLPGAEINERQDDGSYKGTFTVKLGPTTASYRGTLRFEELDEGSHTVTMRGDGTDKRGQGGVKATVISRMHEEGGATHVEVDTDLSITGRLARFGRGGMVQDVSTKLLDRFAECLKQDLTAPSAAAETEAAPAAPEAAAPTAAPAADDASATEAAGAGPAAAAAAASGPAVGAAGSPPPPPQSPPPPPRPAAEPFDAGALAGEMLAQRAKQAAPVLVALLVLAWLLRRR
jgi:uncharacterized protein